MYFNSNALFVNGISEGEDDKITDNLDVFLDLIKYCSYILI